MMPNQLVVILGMHRSGTSLLTSSLPLLGYALGENLMPGNEDNPKGFFEDLDVVALNDEVLAHNFASWDSPLGNMVGELQFTADHVDQARTLLRQKFAETSKWVMKDPRLCLLLPFWQAQFDVLEIDVRYVGVYRDPVAIAASLEKRNQFEQRHGLLLSYIYLRSMLRILGDDVFVVSYDEFLEFPQEQIARLAGFLNSEVDPESITTFIQKTIDPGLRHYRHETGDLFPALRTLVELMQRRAKDEAVPVASQVELLPEDPALERELLAIQLRREFAERQGASQRFDELEQARRDLESQKKLLEADVKDRTARLEEREKHIGVLEQEVSRLGDELHQSAGIIVERDEELAATKRDFQAQVNLLERNLESTYGTIDSLRAELADETAEIARLNHHLDDFDRLHKDVLNSVSFRLGRVITYPIRKPFQILILNRLSQDSFWRRIIGFVRQCISHPIATLRLLTPSRVKNFFLLLTKRRDLADQIIANYEDVLVEQPELTAGDVHHYSEEELATYQLSLSTSEQPLVSVVIPVYNQLDHTLRCLESIAENSPEVSFEVVVANDCSTDATAEVIDRIDGVRLINNDENLKFLLNCNNAVDYCRGDYIFLLNNDTAVRPGWLDSLVNVFLERPDTGLVGSKLIYPDGRLQEAGGIVWRDASAWNYGRLQDPKAPEFNYVREADYVSGAAIMVRRSTFSDLGRFDTLFEPAYYEDTDLAFKIRAAGLKVYYQPQSEIVHYEGISHGTDESAGLKQHQVVNKDRFFAKWQSVLEAEHFPNGERVMTARDRASGKPTVLVVDHYVPHFDKDAGSRSTYLYLKLLVDAGCQVKFLGDNFYQHEPYTSVLQAMGIEVFYGRECEKNWKSWLQQHAPELDVVYLMRPHIAEKYIDDINNLEPRPRTIYFGHDLHFLRLQRQYEIDGSNQTAQEAAQWRQKELSLFSKFDQIYYPSQVEVDEIKKIDAELPVKAIPLYPIDQFDDSVVKFKTREGLLFVGGFNHPPNADGLNWFVDEVLPQLNNQIGLNIVGSNMPKEIQDLQSNRVVVHGFLSDAELDALYQKVRLVVVPLRFGAGIKGKVLEAMNRGVPVVTTQVGAEGIPLADELLIVVDDACGMARAIEAMNSDETELQRYSSKGRDAVKRYFSVDAALDVIAEDFKLGSR